MAGRRGASEGTFYKRDDGLWVGQVRLSSGRRKFASRSRHEAAEKVAEAVRLDRHGITPPKGRFTLGEFLDRWIEGRKSSLRQTAYETCQRHIRLHIAPAIGSKLLTKLTQQDVQRMEHAMLQQGKAAQTVRNVHWTLHGALDDAVRWNHVLRNVAGLVDPPRAERHEINTLTPDEGQRLLAASAGDRLEALFVLALTGGLRRGELLGLQWADIDLDAGTVTVRREVVTVAGGLRIQEPKTDRSRRPVDISELATDALRRRLDAARREQAAAADDFVFGTTAHTPYNPSNLWSRHWRPILQRAGLETRLHDLRHTNATLMLAGNVHPKIASERLGHSSVRLTLDTYSHVLQGMGRSAADTVDKLLTPPATASSGASRQDGRIPERTRAPRRRRAG